MAFTEYNKETAIIGGLGTNPAERGLTTQEFKDKFDQFAEEFVTWFNATHLAEAAEKEVVDAHLAETVSQVAWFAKNSIPATGWLKCNGAAVSRTTYSALFSAIGTVFGVGDGSTTFNLPDLRSNFVRGWSDNSSIDAGRVFGSLQDYAIQAHSHSIPTYQGTSTYVGNKVAGGNTTSWDNGVTADTGGTETRPRNVALLACIKY